MANNSTATLRPTYAPSHVSIKRHTDEPCNVMPVAHGFKFGSLTVRFNGWTMEEAVAVVVAKNGHTYTLNRNGDLRDLTENRVPGCSDLDDEHVRGAIRCLIKALKALVAINEAFETVDVHSCTYFEYRVATNR